MPVTKLNPALRRELAKRALSGESPRALSKEFGVTEARVYQTRWETLADPLSSLRDAQEELEFRAWVAEKFSKKKATTRAASTNGLEAN